MQARAVLFDELGGPGVLYVKEVELEEPGPGEVRLRVDAIGLNRGEALLRAGGYYYDAVLPASRLGTEAAGVIEALGNGVTGYAVGDAVSVVAKPNDDGMSAYGVYGDRVNVDARRLIRRPDGMDAVTGAALWVPGFTVYGALVEVGRIQPGDHVVITAASSSIGVAAIQLANHVGATPIAVTRTQAKADRLRDLGATHVIVSQGSDVDDMGEVVEQVRGLTGGHGARLVLDSVAGPALPKLASAVAPDGMLIVNGSLDGRPTPLPMWWPINVYGYAIFHLFADPERIRRAEAFLVSGLRAGALTPVIDRTFDLTDIVTAHKYLEANSHVGKLVVTVTH